MVRSIGVQLGLLSFGIAILAGLYAGNAPTTILLRALVVMVSACALGQFAGWAAKQILRDHLQRKKAAIDREHVEALRGEQADQTSAPPTAEPVKAG